MKIALIAPMALRCPPRSYGGTERVIYDLGIALTKLGHDVTLFAPKGSRLKGGEVVEIGDPLGGRGARWFDKEMEAYEVYRDKVEGFDIVHGHTWWALEYLVKLKNPDLKVTHTVHGHLDYKSPYSPPSPIKHRNLVAVSKFLALECTERQRANYRFVYPGVNIDLYRFKPRKGERLLFVGRFSRGKQPHVAIEVAKKLKAPLDLVGGGTFVEDPSYVKKIQDQCDGEQIRMFTNVPDGVKVELMQNAKALLFPSNFEEPFGLVAVESLACGTPVVATRDGAIPEVVKDEEVGFVCDSFKQMLDAVKKVDLIEPKNCRRWAENFSRERMAREYMVLYEEILKGNEW